MRVFGWQTRMRNESELLIRGNPFSRVHHGPIQRPLVDGFELEHVCWDQKDGELCLSRVKSEETLMEARRGSDVQIDLQTWV
jgi:hypothetical protein